MTADININLIKNYFSLLKSLSPNNKLELIALLSKSMKSKEKTKDNSWKSLYGSLILDKSALDFVVELKKDRNFNRKTVEF